MRAWVEMQARRDPRITSLARALDQYRWGDETARAAWRDRTANRMRGATGIVQRLRRDGRVHRSWTTGEAATLVWELVSFRVRDDLVNEAGLPPERYTEIVTGAVLGALAAPVRPGPAQPVSSDRAPAGEALGSSLGSCEHHALMAYDEDLANRIRELLRADSDVTEKTMFGGLAFLAGGNLAVAASGQGGLMVRVEPEETDALLAQPGVRPFEMRGRPIDGWLRVDGDGVRTKHQLESWVERGVGYARSLPPKG